MAKRQDVSIKVISQKGVCHAGHKVGDEWILSGEDNKTPAGICLAAFACLYPSARVLMFCGSFFHSDDPDAVTVACPDGKNPLIFELRRLK